MKAKTKTRIDVDRRTRDSGRVSTFHLVVIKAMCRAVRGYRHHSLVTGFSPVFL